MNPTPLLVFALAGGLAAAAVAQEWSRFRGPRGQGHGDADLPARFTAANVRWQVDTGGAGHSSPVLWGRRLFLTREGDASGKREVTCFDADSGTELWSDPRLFTPHEQHELNGSATSTPVVDERGVYVLWTSGPKLVALALDHDGEELWCRELGDFYSNHGSANSPVLHGELVIVANENQGEDCFLMAIDRRTGEPVWRVERQKSARWANYSPPFVWQPEGGDPLVLVASSSHGLTAIDPKTGELAWQANPGFKNRFIAVPCLAGNHLLVNTGSGGSGKECVVFAFAAGSSAEPTIGYRPRRGLPYVPSAIAVDGRFFWFSDAGYVTCLDATSGEEQWRERSDSRFFSSPVTNGKVIWVADRKGRLLTYSTTRFEQLGAFELGSEVFATPALARGAMFVRTAEHLIRLDRGE